ncbi:hypothetical protein PIGBHMHK_00644 [Mycoplasmopsis arginini]|uniref:hypothetical protein n=1 Tax=Mycoplasmopsis arginini TaxID=2094 RepID=UPI00249DD03C|nr:hypothetical protein [Mycoplasmopsis arginini]MDI3349078.1 hypothetical protein [Mycoplasmopsis arginini]
MRKVRVDSLQGGEIFGRLTVVEYSHTYKNGTHSERIVNCKCECGKVIQARTSNLKSGNTVSCGCYQKQRTVSSNQKRKLDEQNNTANLK